MVAASLACGPYAFAWMFPSDNTPISSLKDTVLEDVFVVLVMILAPIIVRISLAPSIRSLAMAIALSASVISAMIIMVVRLTTDSGPFRLDAWPFWIVLSIIPGLFFGVPLAVLVWLAHGRKREGSYDSEDAFDMAAGAWTAVGGAAAIAFVFALVVVVNMPCTAGGSACGPAGLAPRPPRVGENPWALAFAALVIAYGLFQIVRALERRRARHAWIERVKNGLEPDFRIRVLAANEALASLPILSAGGQAVIESVVHDAGDPYRSGAVWAPIALTRG